MTGRRDDRSVVDLFDSIELDCSKWTDEERTAFREAVGVSASGAVGGVLAALMTAAGLEGSGPEGTDVALDQTTLRGLSWIARRRRQPGLSFEDVEVKDRAAIGAAIERQITDVVASVLYGCGPETLALCLSVMLAGACDRAHGQ